MSLTSTPSCRAIVLLFIAAGLSTQVVAAGTGQPSFFIESIVVEGLERASEHIIVSESLLEPGTTYDEDELREAIFRIRRLPFVLTAEFSLQKGSERGRYRLLVTIVETERFFFGVDLQWRENNGPSWFLDGDITDDRLRAIWDDDEPENSAVAGARHFVGTHGVLHAALTTLTDGIELGYTHYNLFDRPIVASFTYGRSENGNEWQATASLGLHLHRNQSLYLRLAMREESNEYLETSRDLASLSWLDDSTDDPVFPTHGRRLEAGFSFDRSSDDTYLILVDFPPPGDVGSIPTYIYEPLQAHYDSLSLRLNGTAYLPLDRRQTLWFGLGLRGAREDGHDRIFEDDRYDLEQDVFESELEVGYRFDLFGGRASHPESDQVVELSAGYLYANRNRDRPALDLANVVLWRERSAERIRLEASYVIRNRWGLFRLGFTYLDLLGGGR